MPDAQRTTGVTTQTREEMRAEEQHPYSMNHEIILSSQRRVNLYDTSQSYENLPKRQAKRMDKNN